MTDTPRDPPSKAMRQRWLAALLPLAAEEGWTAEAARKAAEAAGLDAGAQALAAPGGVGDLLEAFFESAGATARAQLDPGSLAGLRTPQRIAAALKSWFAVLEPNREAVRRAAATSLLPDRLPAALSRTWDTADWIWQAAGDTSEDYNRYTKRALLSALLPGLVAYWLKAPEEDALDAEIFRRLEFAARTGQSLGALVKPWLNIFKPDTQTPPFGR